MPCTTMEVERSIANNTNAPQNATTVAKITRERGWRVEKSVCVSFFGWPADHKFVKKNVFWGILLGDSAKLVC